MLFAIQAPAGRALCSRRVIAIVTGGVGHLGLPYQFPRYLRVTTYQALVD